MKARARKQTDQITEASAPNVNSVQSRKVLAVFDGLKFSKSTLNYAIQFAKEANAFLVGVFLDDSMYRSYNLYKVMKTKGDIEEVMDRLDKKDQEKRDKAVIEFQKACGLAGINYTFHRNTGIAIHELKQESIFADLLVINDNETFNRFSENRPTRFLKELLPDVQCPVLVVPDTFRPIENITFLYDGGPSSVYAIKMFSYLFGEVTHTPVKIFSIKEPGTGTHLPNNKLMREFIKKHFPKAEYIIEKGNPEEQVLGHFRNKKENTLIVLGAYRRSEISRWFKTSMADLLMKELDVPLFIAHNK